MVSITQWKANFMARRELEYPTGRPLYTYRVTTEEFSELESILQERMKVYLKLMSLADVARSLEFFPALFVLYSAEWWRRNYDGTGFSWDPILNTIGAHADGWNQAQRSDCVIRGFQEWKLRLSDAHGLRFLGSVAFQGGLPMQLLGTARGNIGRVLSRVLQLASSGTTDAKEIQEWGRSLATYLPNTYRQTEVFALLTEVVVTVLRLKELANLTNSEGALAKLDQAVPNWRDSFPLPVEDEQAKGLIEQLIHDVAGRVVRNVQHISVERRLEQVSPDQWSLRSDIVLPEYLDATVLGNLFVIDPQNLTRTPTLRLLRGGKATDVTLRKLAGQERYRIDRHPLESRDAVAAGEHAMLLLAASGESKHKEISRGDALESDLPWLFEESTDTSAIYRLLKQGSGTVASTQGIVSIPFHWTLSADDGSSAEMKGSIPALDRSIYFVRGTVRIDGGDGSLYRVRTGQATAAPDLFELRGSRLWETILQPDRAFKGVPKLFRVSEHGLEQVVQGPIGWRIQGSALTTTPERLSGPVTAIWPAQGESKWRSRIVLLPTQAALRIEPGSDISNGSVRFSHWGIAAIHCQTPGVSVNGTVDGDSLVAHFLYQGTDNPPEWTELTASWRGNSTDARLKVPFPSKGIRALDAEGNQLSNGDLLSIDEACHVRMVCFLGEGTQRAELRLGLHRGNHGHPANETLQNIRPNTGESRVEIRLLDHANEIKRMLAGADSLDAHVSIRLRLGTGESLTLRVARYSLEFEKYGASSEVGVSQDQIGQVSIEELEKITVCSVRINAPGEEPLHLCPSKSEGVLSRKWLFPATEIQPEPWLIYTGNDSKLSFRPMLWTVPPSMAETTAVPIPEKANQEAGEDVATEIPLRLMLVLDITDEQERALALAAIIDRIAHNFIDEDWGLAEQMAGTLGHLPLSTLDFWRQITQSPAGMAGLAIRLGNLPANFVERFPTELPFVWESIPLTAWVGAIQALQVQGDVWYGSDAGKQVVSIHLDRRIQVLASSCPSLRFLLEVGRAIATGIINKDLQTLRYPMVGQIYANLLFGGENSRVQRLLQINAESPNWPRGFSDEISSAQSNGFGQYFCPGDFGFRDEVINAPIFLALNAVSDTPVELGHEAKEVEAIRNMQSFDPEWFAEAFDLTVARCIATGVIKLTTD